MTVTFRTIVLDVPASPLGLVPARLVIEHRCNLCRHEVATEHLAAHARSHDDDIDEEVSPAD
jgi:hypothetical protein